MENVVIKVKTKSDSRFLTELARKLGFDAFILYDFEKRYMAREKFAELVQTIDKSNISENQVIQTIKKIRTRRYAKKEKN